MQGMGGAAAGGSKYSRVQCLAAALFNCPDEEGGLHRPGRTPPSVANYFTAVWTPGKACMMKVGVSRQREGRVGKCSFVRLSSCRGASFLYPAIDVYLLMCIFFRVMKLQITHPSYSIHHHHHTQFSQLPQYIRTLHEQQHPPSPSPSPQWTTTSPRPRTNPPTSSSNHPTSTTPKRVQRRMPSPPPSYPNSESKNCGRITVVIPPTPVLPNIKWRG